MFENQTVAEIAVMLDGEPELKANAIAANEMLEAFKSLSAERQLIVVKFLKEKYPSVALVLKRIRR